MLISFHAKQNSFQQGEEKYMGKRIAACGNDCAACPRYTMHPYEKTGEELRHTAELWLKIGYRDHLVTNDEIVGKDKNL